jgi:WhiB family transcriptional regulator, redox-sensing transcriptional regulator
MAHERIAMEDKYNLPVLKAMSDQSWRQYAQCRKMDINLFFGSNSFRTGTVVCAMCPVKRECLEFALENSIPDGVYGGMNSKARSKMKTTDLEEDLTSA